MPLPPPSNAADPMQRVFERQAALDQRLAAIERQKVVQITPFRAYAMPGAGGTTDNFVWSGGELWIFAGGTIIPAAAGAAAGYSLYINGSSNAAVINEFPSAGGTFRMALSTRPVKLGEWSPSGASAVGVVLGNNTINLVPSGTAAGQFAYAEGFVLELPYPAGYSVPGG